MTCRDLVEFLADYLAGGLAPEVRRAFEGHLAGCPECRTYLRGYADTVRLVRLWAKADDAVPADVPAGLVRAILAARAGNPRSAHAIEGPEPACFEEALR